MRNFAVVN